MALMQPLGMDLHEWFVQVNNDNLLDIQFIIIINILLLAFSTQCNR